MAARVLPPSGLVRVPRWGWGDGSFQWPHTHTHAHAHAHAHELDTTRAGGRSIIERGLRDPRIQVRVPVCPFVFVIALVLRMLLSRLGRHVYA